MKFVTVEHPTLDAEPSESAPGHLVARLLLLRWWWADQVERAIRGLAQSLPRRLVTACFLRVVAHGTTGREWGGSVPRNLDVIEALRRWDGVER